MAPERTSVSTDFRPDINGLRALAVIAVVFFHFGVQGFSGGFLGVDVFFVISGFLMTKIIVGKLEKGKFSISDFWLSRARRIFPALAVLCGVLLLLGWISIDPLSYRKLAIHAVSSLVFVSNIIFWQEAGYFDAASHEKWLLHTWSLSVEWQFYVLLPIALLIVWKLQRTHRSMIIAVLLAFVASLGVSIIGTKLRPEAAYYLLPTRAWEMMAGGLAYLCSMHIKPTRRKSLILEYTGLLLIVGTTVALDSRTPWPGYFALFPVLGTVMVILARNTSSPVTCNPIARLIGDTSYSIYLWHWPVVVALSFRGLQNDWIWIGTGIAVAILLGYLSFRFVEVPTRRSGAQSVKSRESLAYVSLAAMLMAAAFFVNRAQGFPSRLGVDAAAYVEMAAAIDDWGHPGTNCDVQIYLTRCFREGQTQQLAMFIGDSLAEQWYPRYGVPKDNASFSTLFLTKGACLPIRGIRISFSGTDCNEFASLAWAEVFKRQPKKLIISSIWLTYFFDASGARRTTVCAVSDDGCERVTDNEKLQGVFDKLIPDVRRAVDMGTTVYILAPTPQSGIDYPKAKLAELSTRQLILPILAADKIEHPGQLFENPEQLYSQGTILSILEYVCEHSGATLILPDRYMCRAGSCSNVDFNGRPIFMDRGHLRKSYVESDAVQWLDELIGVAG